MIETKFKQTEIGLIPEDWDCIPLGKDAEIFRGGSPRPIELYLSRNINGFNWIKIGDVDRDAKYINKTAEKIIPLGAEFSRMVYKGDLLLSNSMSFGRPYLLNIDGCIHDGWLVIKNYQSVYERDYLYYALSSAYVNIQYLNMAAGSSVKNLNKEKVKEVLLACPLSKTEQKNIATTLSSIDQLISSLSKIKEKKRLIKQGAMQQLLTGKKRLPGFDGEWVESELGTIVNIQRGSMLKSSEYQFGSIPVIAGGITPAGFHNVANRNGRTITISASGANAGYISYYKEPIFATDCSTISEGNDYFIDFIYYVLLLKQNDIFRLQTGGAQPHIHPKDIAPLKINIPCLYEEQVAIANILSTMDNEIESLEEERDKYIQLKEGMMQKLLTGQIRLVEAETKQQDLPKAKVANVYFKRSVLAAEIADRLCEEKTFGHVKMEKLIFLTEHLCHVDIDSHYHRDAAGPYDNRALRSIDSQMKKQKWFEAKKEDKGYRYLPMQNRGGHKKYFEKYYADVMPMFEKIIDTFKTSSTEQCEIVATLYSAWDDLLQSHKSFTDDDILNEVLNNWHESKKRITRDRWRIELNWMRDNGFVPQNENR